MAALSVIATTLILKLLGDHVNAATVSVALLTTWIIEQVKYSAATVEKQ